MLAQFLEAAVQVADIGNRIEDSFTIQRQHQSQRGVRCRMLRTEVQRPDVFTFGRFRFQIINRSQGHQ